MELVHVSYTSLGSLRMSVVDLRSLTVARSELALRPYIVILVEVQMHLFTFLLCI